MKEKEKEEEAAVLPPADFFSIIIGSVRPPMITNRILYIHLYIMYIGGYVRNIRVMRTYLLGNSCVRVRMFYVHILYRHVQIV